MSEATIPSDPNAAAAQINARRLRQLNRQLEGESAEARVAWAIQHCGPSLVMSSSFGAQAAATLHMVTRQRPNIPVIVIDTGYLFPETYGFIETLTQTLNLNTQIYRPRYSTRWQETRLGPLWQEGVQGIEAYNRINKLEPMRRALRELQAVGWLSGIRRDQSSSRQSTPILQLRNGRLKIHPIADWTDRTVYHYLTQHKLPYHPLWDQGYVSIGDVHTTRPLGAGMDAEDTRFFGLKRECGLHQDV